MMGSKGAVDRRFGQRRAFDLDHGHVDRAARIQAFPPDALTVAVQRNRKSGGSGSVVRVDVQFDLDAVRQVLTRFVDHHVTARHQEQPCFALKEKAARIGQQLLPFEGEDARGGEQK